MWRTDRDFNPTHIALADWAEIVVVSPATANIVGKLANGIADDLLSTLLLSVDVPVVLAPAMNVRMWENVVVGENVAKLKSRGVHIVEPEEGYLACGAVGKGRLASTERILEAVQSRLT